MAEKEFRITYRMEVYVKAETEEEAIIEFQNMDLDKAKTEFVERVSVEEQE